MSEGKHRETWDGHTIAVVASMTGKAARYDDLASGDAGRDADDDDLTTGDPVADWNYAAGILGGATP